MSTCPRPHRSSRLRISSNTSRCLALSSRPFCLTEDSPISWITNYRGHTYELAHDGRLLHLQQTPRPPQEQEASMTEPLDPAYTTRIPGVPDPEPTITRIVAEEMHALALRREAHRRAQEER